MAVSGGSVYLTGLIIQSNAAAGAGGGIHVSGENRAATYCRIVGNSAVSGRGIARIGGTATATNSWWGTNNAPAALMSGTVNYTPWLVLTHTASPTTILTSATTTLTASFVTNSAGTAIAAGNLLRWSACPSPFTNLPCGSISGAQATIQAGGTATATFNAGPTGGVASADAVVDGVVVTTTFTVQQPPSFIFCQPDITSNNTPGSVQCRRHLQRERHRLSAAAVTFSTPSGSVFPVGATAVTATATNGVAAERHVQLSPSRSWTPRRRPSLSGRRVATEDPMGSGGADVKFYAPSASDNCSGVAAPVVTPPSDSLFPVGTNAVTNTVADLAGNLATCKFHVVVRPATNDAFRIIDVEPQSNDLLILWTTPGGRTNALQSRRSARTAATPTSSSTSPAHRYASSRRSATPSPTISSTAASPTRPPATTASAPPDEGTLLRPRRSRRGAQALGP